MNQNTFHRPICASPAPGGHRQRGFTLLEVLIALVVLAVGMLGIAALQARGMQYNTDAYARTQATILAYDIIDRMRTRSYPLSNDPDKNKLEDAMLLYTTTAANTDGACDPASTSVAEELECWQLEIDRTLPGGTNGTVTCNPCNDDGNPNNDIYQVNLSWVNRAAAGAAATPVMVSFQP
ncbi:MAG: type IV pilus modification protein PilV [Gammaproteobacteria bacterium]